MPIRRKIGSTSGDITDALAAEPVTRRPTLMEQATGQAPSRPAPTPPVQRGAMRPRQIQGVSPAELQATMRRVAAGGPVTIHANGVPVARVTTVESARAPRPDDIAIDAAMLDLAQHDAVRRTAFAASVASMPPEMLEQAGFSREETAELAAGIREAAINQTLEGMRANPAMVPMVRELVNSPDRPEGYDPNEDQLALALRRYDAENHVCRICDGGPGNENACMCGLDRGPDPIPEPTPTPAPSRPVRNWGDDE